MTRKEANMKENELIGALTPERSGVIRAEYESDEKNAIIRRALSKNQLSTVIFNSESIPAVEMNYSTEVKTMSVCNQRSSGRCWIFAGLNILREIVAKKIDMKEFQLSQNYISLYDKIEKANFALETILEFLGRDHDDREVHWILRDPVSDGGQWDMFVNLVKKYGLLPQNQFPETFQSNNTQQTDFLVNAAIRGFAAKAFGLYKEGADIKTIRLLKEDCIKKIYAMFLNAFGVPPKRFDFEWTDKDGKYHIEKGLTPLSFFEKYVGSEIDEYQSLINSPTKEKPFHKNYTIEHLGNVWEGKKINHLNLPMERLKEVIIAQLKAGYPVWFGSDVSFYRERTHFAWDDKALDYRDAFGFDIDFDKADMLDYWHSAMNHAMVIVGVNEAEGKANRWKIENSWGKDVGENGYYAMSGTWFDKFVYQAVVRKEFLSEEERKEAAAEPTPLHPWDPMGTLAD